MKIGRRRLLDAALILVGIGILFFLLQAPPATTPNLPANELHRPFWNTAILQGKKSAETSCQSCHNPDQVPFTADHPAGRRCLFCHRLPENQPAAP
ncbi:hypothetical protein A7E78_11105 [Syntrophotalea acetylenivorans]|uniref:Uncharacterized protein n=1 Tax=Syntrophotalea acetylenivorans TaxID=1842532 RepID=A0A1L3GQX7_9BACT|nr:hypothetical protein [Syntrophotalea acetylenivorans]APG28349.1 hypothetical protein A7E78_11105 [Syntrophotalea acetylenivorans]